MTTIRMLNGEEARAAIPQLAEILADCVDDGASLGFMQPYTVEDAVSFWQNVADGIAAGGTLLLVAEIDGRMVGTVQVGFARPIRPIGAT
jgi:hypothetical protein